MAKKKKRPPYSFGALAMLALCLSPFVAHAAGGAEAESVVAVTDVLVTSTATAVKAGNGARVFLSCTNNDASVNVRWGDSTVSATKGQRLPANTSIEIKNRDAVYMISEGADVTVSCTEELR